MSEFNAEEIKKMVLRDLLPGFYDFKTMEFSPYHTDIRFDVIGLQRYNRTSRIVEVKSCRADFLSDHKWEKYLPFATHMYFAAPPGAIHPEELPPEIGLAEIQTNGAGYPFLRYIKKCKRLPALMDESYIKLVEGAFVRLKMELEDIQKAAQVGKGKGNESSR